MLKTRIGSQFTISLIFTPLRLLATSTPRAMMPPSATEMLHPDEAVSFSAAAHTP